VSHACVVSLAFTKHVSVVIESISSLKHADLELKILEVDQKKCNVEGWRPGARHIATY